MADLHNAHTYTHTHIHTYIYTQTHIHIHIYTDIANAAQGIRPSFSLQGGRGQGTRLALKVFSRHDIMDGLLRL